MRTQRLAIAISICSTLSSTCWATPPVAQGIIHFSGRIVERPCDTDMGSHSRFELTGCPASTRSTVVQANGVDPWNSASIKVQLLSDSGGMRYYDQQYQLLDEAGLPLRSGNYVVTMSLP